MTAHLWTPLLQPDTRQRDSRDVQALLVQFQLRGDRPALTETRKSTQKLLQGQVSFLDAMWLIATGRLFARDRSKEARAMKLVADAAPHRAAEEKDLPLGVRRWISSFRRSSGAERELLGAGHMHDWIRWGVQRKLTVSASFWPLFYRARAMNWSRGVEVAVAIWESGAQKRLKYHSMTVEEFWQLPYSEELELAEKYADDDELQWLFTWRAPREKDIEDAIVSQMAMQSPERTQAAIKSAGFKTVGDIRDAVRSLAAKRRLRASDGIFDFRCTRDELIADLRELVPELQHTADSSFRKCLPLFATTRSRGRPRGSRSAPRMTDLGQAASLDAEGEVRPAN